MEMKDQVLKALEQVRARLRLEGGDIELVGIANGVVKVRLCGACAGCPGAQMTLKMGVERILKESVPGVKAVQAV